MSGGADAVPRNGRLGLSRALSEEKSSVEAALEDAVDVLSAELPAGLDPVVRHGVLGGGKRIRPILCVAAFRACGGPDDAPIQRLAVSLELIHAYSLMHDDLPCMDDADLRRGRATPHRIHGEGSTMVAGAVLIPAAALQAWRACRALDLDAGDARPVVRDLLVAAGAAGMVGGQVLDLLGEERALDADELDQLHEKKTGALLAAAPSMGGRAAGAGRETIGALERYGRELGLAFQIADDILDATGTAGELGKEPSDRELEKSTFVSRYGIEGARERARERAEGARRALDGAKLDAPLLHELARYVVRRRT